MYCHRSIMVNLAKFIETTEQKESLPSEADQSEGLIFCFAAK